MENDLGLVWEDFSAKVLQYLKFISKIVYVLEQIRKYKLGILMCF